jgi:hypothetical protein
VKSLMKNIYEIDSKASLNLLLNIGKI